MQRHHVSRSRIQRVHGEHFSRNISLTQCECASAPKHYQTELDPLFESHISGLVEAWQGICRPTTPRAHSQIVVGTCRPGVATSMQLTPDKSNPMRHAQHLRKETRPKTAYHFHARMPTITNYLERLPFDPSWALIPDFACVGLREGVGWHRPLVLGLLGCAM